MLCMMIVFSCREDESENISSFQKNTQRVRFDEQSQEPLVQYILNADNEESKNCNLHIRKALDYAKIPFSVIPLKKFNQNFKIDSTTKVLAIYDVGLLTNQSYQQVLKFIAQGGTLFLPSFSSDEKFGFLAGVKSDANYSINQTATGYRFHLNMLPGLKNTRFQNKIRHFGLKQENFKDEIEIWASAYNNPEYPTIIRNQLGKGQIIAFNSSQYAEKQDRGLFFASILQGLPHIPYSIANVSSIFLDDFPAPLYDVYAETIQTEMNLSQAQFYTNVWWPDMIKLARDENIVYSTYPCFDYRNITQPPFLFKEWDHHSSTLKEHTNDVPAYLMSLALKEHQEIGLHGYNHVSLIASDWPNEDFMILSLESVEKKWIYSNYGKLPRTYVPPSNDIDSIGFSALEKAIPSIRYNCSLYIGEFEDGGGREFDPEPYNHHFFNFPRISSGYDINAEEEFNQHSLYLYTGIWSHFIHPDDVYQVPSDKNTSHGSYAYRNTKRLGWRTSKNGELGFLPLFKNYLEKTRKIYPFIRYQKVVDAAKHTENWRKSKVSYNFTPDSIQLKTSLQLTENYWFIYFPEAETTKIEAYLTHKNIPYSKRDFLLGSLFNIKTKSDQLTLPNYQKKSTPIDFQQILASYENYLDNHEEFIDESPDLPVEARIETLLLQQKKSGLSQKDWLALYQYLGWENREFEIWPLLEHSFQENPSRNLVNLSLLFTKNSDYSDADTRQRWMLRQAEFIDEQVELKLKYLIEFNEETNLDEITISAEEIVDIIEATTDEQTQEEYLYGLIDKHPALALKVFNNIEACGNLNNRLSESIAWFYKEKNDLEKAIAWSHCTPTINQEEVTEWRLENGEFMFLKQQNFPRYIAYLLQKNAPYALKEVINLTPCENKKLQSQATDLAYAFADQGSFRKALQWSECVQNFPEKDRLQWLYELGDLEKLASEYLSYIEKNPEDSEVKATMAQLYLYANQFDKSWKLASILKDSPEKTQLQVELNKEVLTIPEKNQFALLEVEPDFFLPEVRKKIEKKRRIQQNDFIETNSELISDLLKPTSFTNILAYGVRDKKLHTHTFGLTKYNAYALNIDTSSVNRNHYLYGIRYGFKTKERQEKINYVAKARVEFDRDQRVFYHLRVGASISKDSFFSSLQLFYRPAITGPAYSLGIYQTQVNVYEEWKINSNWNAIGSLEANHYDDKNVIDAMILTKLSYNLTLTKTSSFNPYLEGSGLLGNTNLEQGYPYWSAKERLYGGLGVSYNIKNDAQQIDVGIGAAMFLDTFSGSFQRYRATLSMPVFDSLFVNANAEFFTLENFIVFIITWTNA